MKDIVHRLRDGKRGPNHFLIEAERWPYATFRDAVDEIERLRAALDDQ